MNLFTLTGEILLNGVDEAQNGVNSVRKTVETEEPKLTKLFKKITTVVASAFAIDKIKDFGVEIVNLSAEVSAEQSAFEQIMGDYAETAQKKLQSVADKTGVTSTRMISHYTSLSSKFKGLGFDVENATDLASRGLELASDASAFWDKSLDDCSSALNSFINGSYEGGEAIGLFANDTQMSQFAVQKGLVESTTAWSKLDEATKQATRLEYAELMYQQSGAVGQASRESEQYANVQGNLAEKWRQFKAEIGTPLLENVVIPAMRKLSTVVDKLSEGYEKLKNWIADNKETIDKWVNAIIIATTIVGAYFVAVSALSILKTLGSWIKAVTSAQTALNIVMSLNPIALVIAGVVALVAGFVLLWNKSESFRNFWVSLWDKIKEVCNPVVESIKASFSSMWDSIKGIWETVEPFFTDLWNGIKDAWDIIYPTLVNAFSVAWENIKVIWDVVVSFFQTIWNNIALIFDVAESVLKGDFNSAWESIKAIWNNCISFFSDVWEGIKSIFNNVITFLPELFDTAWRAIKTIWNSVEPYFDNIWTSIKTVFSNIGTWFKDIFETAWTNIKNAFSNPKEFFSAVWANIKSAFSGVKTFFSGLWEDIVNAFDISDITNIGVNLVQGLWNGISSVKDWIIDKVKGFGNSILDGFKDFFGIHSPSTLMAWIGEMLGLGVAEGIEDSQSSINASVEQMDEETSSVFSKFLNAIEELCKNNPVFRRIAEAFGFQFAEGIEETLPEVEDAVETVTSTAETTTESAWNKFTKKIKDFGATFYSVYSQSIDYLTGIGNAIYEYQDQQLENQIDALDEEIEALQDATDEKLEIAQTEHDEKLALLNDQLEQGLLSETEYNKQKEKLATELSDATQKIQDEESEHELQLKKQQDELSRKQFEAKKKSEIANVWVNFATATMRAFAENYWGVALGIATALGVQAGIQTATINSQKYTSAFAEGGIIDEPTVGLVGEAGKEAVVPLENNTEWVGGLAKAISPAIIEQSSTNKTEVENLRSEVVTLRKMLSEMLNKLINKDTQIVLNSSELAYAIAPSIDSNLGNINRYKNRGI